MTKFTIRSNLWHLYEVKLGMRWMKILSNPKNLNLKMLHVLQFKSKLCETFANSFRKVNPFWICLWVKFMPILFVCLVQHKEFLHQLFFKDLIFSNFVIFSPSKIVHFESKYEFEFSRELFKKIQQIAVQFYITTEHVQHWTSQFCRQVLYLKSLFNSEINMCLTWVSITNL